MIQHIWWGATTRRDRVLFMCVFIFCSVQVPHTTFAMLNNLLTIVSRIKASKKGSLTLFDGEPTLWEGQILPFSLCISLDFVVFKYQALFGDFGLDLWSRTIWTIRTLWSWTIHNPERIFKVKYAPGPYLKCILLQEHVYYMLLEQYAF